tara:strand:+ start:1359 stop:1961 length:603 start_codon:yes stop_codon:yes gene_type:complete
MQKLFKTLWDSTTLSECRKTMQKSKREYCKNTNQDDGLVTMGGGFYIVTDNEKRDRAIDEPFFYADYPTKKHTKEVFEEAMKLGINSFTISFNWDFRYWDTYQDKFNYQVYAEHSGSGDGFDLVTYDISNPRKLSQKVIDLICKDIKQGIVPGDVKSFDELQSYVDANMYFVECGFNFNSTTDIGILNQVIDKVDKWIKS